MNEVVLIGLGQGERKVPEVRMDLCKGEREEEERGLRRRRDSPGREGHLAARKQDATPFRK